jgi:hypothetical protein
VLAPRCGERKNILVPRHTEKIGIILTIRFQDTEKGLPYWPLGEEKDPNTDFQV